MTIKYRLAELKSKIIKKGTAYIGQIVHNASLDIDEMAERYADKYKLPLSTAKFNLGSTVEYIESEVAAGNRLNFSSFSVSLKMTGRFERANAVYSETENPIRVVMTPNKKLHAAAASLTPIDETARSKPWIDSVVHHQMKPDEYTLMNVIRLNGGLTTMNAYHCRVDTSREDEGVWLTSLDGQVLLLKAEIKDNSEATCDVVFPASDLPAGEYRIEIRSRGTPTNPLVSASRKVEVRVG